MKNKETFSNLFCEYEDGTKERRAWIFSEDRYKLRHGESPEINKFLVVKALERLNLKTI